MAGFCECASHRRRGNEARSRLGARPPQKTPALEDLAEQYAIAERRMVAGLLRRGVHGLRAAVEHHSGCFKQVLN